MKRRSLLLFSLLSSLFSLSAAILSSPNRAVVARIDQASPQEPLTLQISREGEALLSPSPISLNFRDAKPPRMGKTKFKTNVSETIAAPFYRQKEFTVSYNQMTVQLGNGTSLEVRTFDDGVAYRFISNKATGIIDSETADYRLPGDVKTIIAYQPDGDKPFTTAFQNTYRYDSLSQAKTDQLAFLPITVDYKPFYGNNVKMTITESDLRAYPGMFIHPHPETLSLEGVFAAYPSKTAENSWRQQTYVVEREDFIAKTDAPRTFPWRIFAITDDDRQMPTNNLVYALAEPSRVADPRWIRPGKAQWDWWHDWTERGVPFRAGLNTATYKHYIDFAASQGLPYIVIDEGWYVPSSGDMLTVIPDINLPELVAYGKERNVGIVLWTVFNVLDTQLAEACQKYADLGIKGFKVDFMDRDDQTAVEQAYRIAQACADAGLMLDYHGIYKPTGMNRTFPNIINFEAVFGMEEAKWTDIDQHDMPLYDVTFPYIRMMAGPVDFTPGAMRNANRRDWRAVYSEPMSQGTRAHQAASYVVVDSPFTMFADKPSAYAAEPDYTAFIAALPDVYDSTQILQGELGEYIITARQGADGNWYVAGQTNWTPRDIILPLDFLNGSAPYALRLLADGVNADRNAMDYAISEAAAVNSEPLKIHMAPGGGFVAVFSPINQK